MAASIFRSSRSYRPHPASPSQYGPYFSSKTYDFTLQHFTITWILAMSNTSRTSPAVYGLVLIPIVIAASAAFVAIQSTQIGKDILRRCSNLWQVWSPSHKQDRRRKHKRSDISSSQVFADSWCDLESIHSGQAATKFIGQSSPKAHGYTRNSPDTPTRVWHPQRSNRLTWSFTHPQSRSPHLFELSSVAKPLPVVQRPEKSSEIEVEASLNPPTKVREARRWVQTDP